MIENVLTCDDCKQAALDVDEVVCPTDTLYLKNGRVKVKLCDNCYEQRCDKIEDI